MCSRVTTAFLISAGLLTGVAFSQTPPKQTQDTVIAQQDRPTFRVIVIGRETKAINFRPRKGETQIDFVGSPLSPKAHGEATVKGDKGYFTIDAHFKSLAPPSNIGPEYLTYVLWAITPEGRTENIGELQVSGDDGELKVSTELQAFGLIVTAEPYFAVTQPTDVVVMEGAFRKEGIFKDQTLGTAEVIDAKYELLNRGTYLLNHDASQFRRKPLEPGAPLDLAEARNAVEIARLNGADKYAADTYNKASQLLAQAELARERRKSGKEVQQPARQAAQTAEDARLIAVRRMEEEAQAQQRALLAQREEEARRERERAQVEADHARAESERARLESERAQSEQARRLQAEQDRLSAQAARDAAERAKLDADAAAARLAQEKADADAAAARLAQEQQAAEAARLAAERARADAEAQARQAQANAEAADRERAELRERLRQQLNSVLETRETARGLIVNISDVLFDTDKATLKPGAREKLARVSGILLAQPGINVAVEGHADSTGATDYNQRLSERRAGSVRDYLVGQGISGGAVATAGFGETRPVATNDTAAGRQQNRRVELVVSGDAITTRTTTRTTTVEPR